MNSGDPTAGPAVRDDGAHSPGRRPWRGTVCCRAAKAVRAAARVVCGQRRSAIDAKGFSTAREPERASVFGPRLSRLRHHRNPRRDETDNTVAANDTIVARFAQREDRPWSARTAHPFRRRIRLAGRKESRRSRERRHVRALGHEAHVAKVGS